MVDFTSVHDVTIVLKTALPKEVLRIVIQQKDSEKAEVVHTVSFSI